MTLSQLCTVFVVIFLIFSLYREWFNPSLTFFISALALLVSGVITVPELLKGLSNPQIIIIFLLVLVTAGIRIIFGSNIFERIFSLRLAPRAFLIRMMMTVSVVSAFLNNTPIVAFMVPYVKDWAARTGHSSSKFLIPLSYATILGGMITVIGTSTNLVLNGLISEYRLPLLHFEDFAYLGVLVTFFGWIYLYYFGYNLLPHNKEQITGIRQNLKEYLVETRVFHQSKLIGKSVREAGLRQLKDLFLVEIVRQGVPISPVSPEEVIHEADILFFSGNTESIYQLIQEDNGLGLPNQDQLESQGQFNFSEAVIPSGSDLVGVRVKESDFRSRFNASIVAVHRQGKRIEGSVGETHLAGGDFLLLVLGDAGSHSQNEKDLFFLTVPKPLSTSKPRWHAWLGLISFGLLLVGIVGALPLFTICLVVLSLLIFFRVLSLNEIKRNLDLGLMVILVCSLAIGIALEKSGTARLAASVIVQAGEWGGPVAVLTALFVTTLFLTALITNAAAVSIVFPIAMAVGQQMNLPYTPFFVAIAFAASGDFMTPIGYQTNLMVYGPGGYTFRDFLRVGTPLTLIYTLICIVFITLYYQLI